MKKFDSKMIVCGYENLHVHSDFSTLDGYGQVEEYADRCTKINMNYLCVTDHGMMGVIPRQIRACDKMGLKAIFGIELYVNDSRVHRDDIKLLPPDEKADASTSYHLLAIAYNNIGYSNLVQLSSWAWLHGFYKKPRVNHEQLIKHREGIIFTSCCYNSEVGRAFDRGGADAADAMIEKYIAMFGDNYYLEFMLLDFHKQRAYNAYIVRAAEKYGRKILLTNDTHYCNKCDSRQQQYMLMIRNNTTIKSVQLKVDAGEDVFEMQDSNLWLKSEDELDQKYIEIPPESRWREGDPYSKMAYSEIIPYEVYCQAKRNTVDVCRKAAGVELDRSVKLPQIPEANKKLMSKLKHGVNWRGLRHKPNYIKRLEEEYELITRKGFASYFLIQQTITDEARRTCPEILGWDAGDFALGPGRGCLSGDVPVVLCDGSTKPIRDVCVSDKVIDRNGVTRKVLNKFKYACEEKLLRINCYYGDKNGVALTFDHKVLAEKCRRPEKYDACSNNTLQSMKAFEEPTGEMTWMRAEDLSIGDWVFIPKVLTSFNSSMEVDLEKYADDKNMIVGECRETVEQLRTNSLTKDIHSNESFSRFITLDHDWMTVIGIFTSDGWLRTGRVGFCLHSDDVAGLALIKKKFSELGISSTVLEGYQGKKLMEINIHNRFVYRWFKDMFCDCESTSQTKHVPNVVKGLDDTMVAAFLKGYHWADGHEEYANKFSTRSLKLADEVRWLHWRLGIPASLAVADRHDKRTGKSSKKFSVKSPKNEGINTFDDRNAYTYRQVENGILCRICSIKEEASDGWVYDIEVEEEHNYLTSSFIVHNSAVGSLICYCLGITNVDPIRHGLLFSRFLNESRGGRQIKTRFASQPI